MPGDVNFNINNINVPKSPIFWILVAIAVFLILLATGHVATAVVMFLLAVAIICFIVNISSSYPSNNVWTICIFCFVLALILGVLFVPDEWQFKVIQTLPTPSGTTP